MHSLRRLYYTLQPLKWSQWWYRFAQPLAKIFWKSPAASEREIEAALSHPRLSLQSLEVPQRLSLKESGKEFCFLNICHIFPQEIDWNCRAHGLLWAFNLHYFEWLYDDALPVATCVRIMEDYAARTVDLPIARSPYPASLRIVAWVRFMLRNGLSSESIAAHIYERAAAIARFPEYALDGNHLWENALALLHAGAFFRNDRFFQKGTKLMRQCLREQLFEDGGHKEGSPMYHSLLLWRTLQCVEVLEVLGMDDTKIVSETRVAAAKMLGWLQAMTFSDNSWSAVNDTTDGIAPSTATLGHYAATLRIAPIAVGIKDSGYKLIRMPTWELFIDAADIQPSWQPGHTHADTGTFCLHLDGKPFIVDTGVSTYEDSPRRKMERSTMSHNTLLVDGQSSSDVWKSFRVGRRSRIVAFSCSPTEISLTHDGYKQAGILHTRNFSWNDKAIVISDTALGGRAGRQIQFHFHPSIKVRRTGENTFSAGLTSISIKGASRAWCEFYEWSAGFNKLITAMRICALLADFECTTIIQRNQ